MTLRILCLVLLFCNVAAFRADSSLRLHSRRAHRVHRVHTHKNMSSDLNFMHLMATDCQCKFSGTCTCEAAMQFMDCIEAACKTNQCKCQKDDGTNQYGAACGVMGAHCPTIGLQCQAGQSTCGGEAAQSATKKAVAVTSETHVPIERHEADIAARKSHGHHLFAFLFLCLFATLTIAFAMVSSSNEILAKNTWAVIDSIAVTSIAVTLFYVFDHIFTDLTAGIAHMKILLHVIYALVVFFVAIFGSYILRNDKVGQAAFNAVIYWICLLAKGGALTTAQSSLPASLLDVCIITGASLVFFLVLILVTHQIKPASGWYDSVETNLAGGAFAAGVCQFVGIVINGLDHHPEKAQDNQKVLMTNGFAFFTCVCAILLTPPLSRMQAANKKYWYGRFLTFVDGFVGIMPYFTVSLGTGAVVCHVLDITNGTLMAKLVHAMTSVVVGGLMVLVVAFTPYLNKPRDDIKVLAGLILGFGGYIAGYALASLLCGTISEVVEGRGLEGHQKSQVKMLIVAGFNLLLVPVYVMYLKPLVMKKCA